MSENTHDPLRWAVHDAIVQANDQDLNPTRSEVVPLVRGFDPDAPAPAAIEAALDTLESQGDVYAVDGRYRATTPERPPLPRGSSPEDAPATVTIPAGTVESVRSTVSYHDTGAGVTMARVGEFLRLDVEYLGSVAAELARRGELIPVADPDDGPTRYRAVRPPVATTE